MLVTFCSYPTYEEWKHNLIELGKSIESSSYPTYEEWKRNNTTNLKLLDNVLILPMRNGNE